MLILNERETGTVKGVGHDKLKIVIDGDTFEEVQGIQAREKAREVAASRGYGSGGMTDQPIVGPIGVDGQMLENEDAINPNAEVTGYRVEFLFANKA